VAALAYFGLVRPRLAAATRAAGLDPARPLTPR
jgi:hypothetical protein